MRPQAWTCLLMLASSTALAAQVPAAPAPAAAQQAAPAMSAGAQSGAPADYKLGIGDRVRLSVYNEPDLSGEFTVGATGTMALPLIGDVAATGRTGTEIAAEVQRRLSDGYLKDPHVSTEILTYRPFYILGEVTNPGQYPYQNGLTVMNAVATAHGYTYRANRRKVFIKHAGAATEEQVRLTPDLPVQPGDTIRVGERYF